MRVLTLKMVLVILGGATTALGQSPRFTYESKYYVIHTDLNENDVREAMVRIDGVGEAYYERTRSFAGVIDRKLPFYLFSRSEDYYAAGGLPGSDGVFMDDKLMAIATSPISEPTWSTVQHEGFHQFARFVIGGNLPVWVNEGLAEYFGEGIFTGDGFVDGLVPNDRAERVKWQIEHDEFKPVVDMLLMEYETWLQEISHANYNQAWSLVHFLAQARDGKYRSNFDGFLRELSRGRPQGIAWRNNFGPGADEFEVEWREYWLDLPEDPTADLYAQTTVATLTSFLARAFSQQQEFDSAEAFFKACKEENLSKHPNDYLPPSLLTRELRNVEKAGKWSLSTNRGRSPKLICTRENGKKLIGRFTLVGGSVGEITVDVLGK